MLRKTTLPPQAEILPPSKDRVTLREIAELAGVSVSTASAVLSLKHKDRRISDSVVSRVREVARQQNYAPNLLVRSLRKGRTHVLSFYNGYVFNPRDPNDLFMNRLWAAVEQAAGRYEYDLLLHCAHSRSVDTTYQTLNGGRSDGLLFFGPMLDNPLLPRLRQSQLPTVVLNRTDDEGVLSSVSADMRDGMRQVADKLVGLGHRRIAAVGHGWSPGSLAHVRIESLRSLLAERGALLTETLVYQHSPHELQNDLRRIVADPDPATALFCWNDRCGYLLLDVCQSVGIAVPHTLSIVGYDGVRWPADCPHTLVSVEVPIEKIAENAIQMLDQMIRSETQPPVCRVLPVTLSTGTTVASALANHDLRGHEAAALNQGGLL